MHSIWKFLTKRRRFPSMREAFKAGQQFVLRRRAKALEDISSIGRDTMKAGVLAIVINAWLENRSLTLAAITSVVVGFILWIIGLPLDDDQNPP